MKINPVAIQSYQQISQRDRTAARPNIDDQARASESKATITPQESDAGSRIAVKPVSGNYAEFLTVEEKNALDLLFSRFKDSSKFGPGYARDAAAGSDNSLLGGTIDVKV